jgi:hypothetical protein
MTSSLEMILHLQSLAPRRQATPFTLDSPGWLNTAVITYKRVDLAWNLQ